MTTLLGLASFKPAVAVLGVATLGAGLAVDLVRSHIDRQTLISVIPGYLVFGKRSHNLGRQFVPAASVTSLVTEARPRMARGDLPPPIWLATERIVAQVQGWQVVIVARIFVSEATAMEMKIRNLLSEPGPTIPPDMELLPGKEGDRLSWQERGVSYRVEAGDAALRIWRGSDVHTFEPDDLRGIREAGHSLIAEWTHDRSSVLLTDVWPDRRHAIKAVLDERYRLRQVLRKSSRQ
ncbi:MAG: hypothetical protein JST54_02010 [Deltaproteobacteria bacterium]|nr:hypothetical protein [Deltaproteobacteria bacterium]